jgi:hypothetical protein
VKAAAGLCAAFLAVGALLAGHDNDGFATVARDARLSFRQDAAPDAAVRNCHGLTAHVLDAISGKQLQVYRCEVYLGITTGWNEKCLTDSDGNVAIVSCDGVPKL